MSFIWIDADSREINAKVGSFTWPTGTAGTTLAVTGVGFTPKVLMLFSGHGLTSDGVLSTGVFNFGYAVSPTKRWGTSMITADNAGTTDTARVQYDDAIIKGLTSTSAFDRALDLQSLDADGFTLVVDDQTSLSARTCFYIALGGASLTDADIIEITEAASTGNQNTTSLAFRPDFLFLNHASADDALGSIAASMSVFFSGANSSEQFTAGSASIDGVTAGDTGAYLRYDQFLSNINSAGGVLSLRAAFSQFLSNGFRINYLERSLARKFGVLAMKGVQSKIGTLSTRTDTTDIVVTGLGFAPKLVMFVGLGISESTDDVASTTPAFSFGAASGPTERGAIGFRDQDGVGTSNTASATEHDAAYVMLNTSADTVNAIMDLVSLDADGFTCVMDDTDSGATNVTYVALG